VEGEPSRLKTRRRYHSLLAVPALPCTDCAERRRRTRGKRVRHGNTRSALQVENIPDDRCQRGLFEISRAPSRRLEQPSVLRNAVQQARVGEKNLDRRAWTRKKPACSDKAAIATRNSLVRPKPIAALYESVSARSNRLI